MYIRRAGFDADGEWHNIDLHIWLSEPKSMFCTEAILLGTTEKYHYSTFYRAKHHVVHLKNFNEDDKLDLSAEGVRIFEFCEGAGKTIISVMKTIKLFLGGLGLNPKIPFFGSKVPRYMEKANVDFMYKHLGVVMEKRPDTVLDIDPDLIKSGDFFAVSRLDGIDQIIGLGTGSLSGHSVVALRIDGELHIVESQDGWYWPKQGIQRNPWS